MQTVVSKQKDRIYGMNLQKETSNNHVFMVVTLKHAFFWVVTPCSSETAISACCMLLLASCLFNSFTLKKGVICSSESSGCLQSTQHYNADNYTLQIIISFPTLYLCFVMTKIGTCFYSTYRQKSVVKESLCMPLILLNFSGGWKITPLIHFSAPHHKWKGSQICMFCGDVTVGNQPCPDGIELHFRNRNCHHHQELM